MVGLYFLIEFLWNLNNVFEANSDLDQGSQLYIIKW